MAGTGGGPSRRSHTKSRKGCKTCKKRHIRCDETFPQCRNCTKHQVRCDYMDLPTLTALESPRTPNGPNLLMSPSIDANIELWRQTGTFPFPELAIYPQPQWHTYSKTDLRLIHHMCSVTRDMINNKTSHMTVWSENMPKFLSLAATHSFVMHSILAFSASHLAWISQSSETRNLAFQHHGIALKGLHEVLVGLNKANVDAALASSLLLQWQATDWRGWASLVAGTANIVNTMHSWGHESMFPAFVAEQGVTSPHAHNSPVGSLVAPDVRREHLTTLQLIQGSLQRIQAYIARHDQEGLWVDQLRSYIDRLRATEAPQSSEEQFAQLYALRKWLLWVPISLLASRRKSKAVLTVLAHFYTIAIALEPMFPDVGSVFCANFALGPLEEILRTIDATQPLHGYEHTGHALALMMDYPRELAATYRSRRDWLKQQAAELETVTQGSYSLDSLNLELEQQIAQFPYSGQSLSPAFASSPLNFVPSTLVSGQTSPYHLDVPRTSIDFGSMTGGFLPPLESPVTPSVTYSPHEHHSLDFAMPFGFGGGFVPTPVWT